MAKEGKFQMSQERLDSIKEELEYLQTERTKEVAEQIKEARSFGDLSENSEYDEAKTEQGKVYSRIAELKALVENAEVVEIISTVGTVGMGSLVCVEDLEDGTRESYQIVGAQEIDIDAEIMKISAESPVGRALLNHAEGETVEVSAPDGVFSYKIISIEN